MTERGIKVLRGEPLEPIKDNPVASIEEIKAIIKKYRNTGSALDTATGFHLIGRVIDRLSAVETNKVQRKECYCGFCKEHIECTKPSHTTGISWGS